MRALFWTILFLCLSTVAPDTTNTATTTFKAFEPSYPKIKINTKTESLLQRGLVYSTTFRNNRQDRTVVIQDINAPSRIVWSILLDFDLYAARGYPQMMDSNLYGKRKLKCVVGFPMTTTKLEYYLQYTQKQTSLVWELDSEKESDFLQNYGYWHVESVSRTSSRVYYSAEVEIETEFLPHFVVDFYNAKALTETISWLQTNSEALYEKTKSKPSRMQNVMQTIKGYNKKLLQKIGRSKTCPGGTTKDGVCLVQPLTQAHKDQEIGLLRVSLMASAFVLALFNVHLYFSQ